MLHLDNVDNRKPKLGILNSSSLEVSYGGVAPFIKNLDPSLQEKFAVTYFALPPSWHRIEIIPRRLLFLLWVTLNIFRLRRQDMILSHVPEGSFIASFCGRPFAHIFHGNFNPMSQSRYWYGRFFMKLFQMIENRILRTASLKYTVGNERPGVPKILNPVRHNIKPKPISDRKGFIYSGRLEAIKNIDRLIVIYSELPQQIREENPFDIAGVGTQEGKLRDLVRRLGLDNHVRFLGSLPNEGLIEADSQHRLLLMASSQEGLPMAIVEALSVEVPVVTTDVGDIARAIQDGVNGHLLPLSFTNSQYVNSIVNILENYEVFSMNAGNSAKIFSAESVAESLSKDMMNVLSAKNSVEKVE